MTHPHWPNLSPDRSTYTCGTCGSDALVIAAVLGYHSHPEWFVRCGNGHALVPVPGTEYRVSGGRSVTSYPPHTPAT